MEFSRSKKLTTLLTCSLILGLSFSLKYKKVLEKNIKNLKSTNQEGLKVYTRLKLGIKTLKCIDLTWKVPTEP